MAVETTINVSGMTCSGCEAAVDRALQRLDGVVRVAADHSADTVRLRFDPDRITVSEVAERIAAAGYQPRLAESDRPGAGSPDE